MIDRIFEKIDHKYKSCLLLLLSIFTVLYLALIGGKNIWSDETYTLSMVTHSYVEICKLTAADVHPPLYYFIVKILTQPFGYSFLSSKVVSIVPYVLLIAFGGIQLRKLFSTKVAIFFMVCFFLFPFALLYAIEVRMYSWAALFVFACGLYAYRCYYENSVRLWMLFVLSGTAAAYTHYFAMVSVSIIYALLLFSILFNRKKQFKQWCVASVVTIFLYAPWINSLINQLVYKVYHKYWIKPITLSTLYGYISSIFGVKGIQYCAYIIVLAYFIVFLVVVLKKDKKTIVLSVLSLSIPIGTIIVGVIASVLVRPVFVIRYVIPAIPFLILFLSIGLNKITDQRLLISILLVVFCVGCISYISTIHREYSIRDNALDETFIEKYENVDCYVVQTQSTEPVWVLAHYANNKNVYQIYSVHPNIPFENIQDVRDFDYKNYNTIVFLIESNEEVPENFSTVYQCTYIGTFNEAHIYYDAFYLTK